MRRSALAALLSACLAVSPAAASGSYRVDNYGSDVTGDGSSAAPFQHMAFCKAYAYAHDTGGAWCVQTSGQVFQEFLQIFYPFPGGGTLQFGSSGPGPFLWAPPQGGHAAQIGDGALVGVQSAHMVMSSGIPAISYFTEHQVGVLDVNVSVTMDGGPSDFIDCDQDSHININNGISTGGGLSNFEYVACPGSTWNINGAETHVNPTSFNRWAWIQPGATMVIQGNVSFGSGLTTSPALINGGANLLNLSGSAMPGGTPVGNGRYCTSLTTC